MISRTNEMDVTKHVAQTRGNNAGERPVMHRRGHNVVSVYAQFTVPLVLLISSAGLMVLGERAASAQSFPNKPIRIVTAPPGGVGGGDYVTRLVAQGITGPMGQPIVVENRPTNTIGALVAKSPADGYTLALLGNSFWLSPLFDKATYDPVTDFIAVTLANRSPNVIVVNPSLPVYNVKDLIALAKAKPGELNYAGGAQGSSSNLSAELFKVMAGVNMTGVNYNGGGPAITAVVSGEVQLRFATEGGPLIKSGQLRPIAVTSAQRSALAPGLPTVGETVPGFVSEVFQAVFAPAGTPRPVINRLNQEIVRVLNQPDVKQRLFDGGSESVPTSPEEAAAAIKADMERMGKLIKNVRATQ